MRWIYFIICCGLFLVACSGGNNPVDNELNDKQIEKSGTEVLNKDSNDDVEVEDEIRNEETDSSYQPGDDIVIEAVIDVSEENKEVVVNGESNLVSGTNLIVELTAEPFGLSRQIAQDMKVEVQKDGTFTKTFPVDDMFFEENNSRPVMVDVRLDMLWANSDDMKEIYGKKGEYFAGLLVYQQESSPERQIVINDLVIVVEGGENSYEMTMPEENVIPEDYGETEVWMEVEVVGNDHHFIYLEGRSNLLEGFWLHGRHNRFKDSVLPTAVPTDTTVRPDGTFNLAIAYDSIVDDGVIRIEGNNTLWTGKTFEKVYGEDLVNISGDIVIEKDGKKSILYEIDHEGKDINIPEDTLLTEEDGEYKINVPDDVLFDFDKSDLKTPAKETLDEVIAILETIETEEQVQIFGHTDDQGSDDYNLKLSEERAKSVEKYLSENGNLGHLTFETVGYGKTKPIESNKTEEGRQKNRRVEIVFQGIE